jgi:hypothetical protein
VKLSKVSGDAFRLWVFGLCYVQDYMSDGRIPIEVLPTLGIPIPTPELAQELVAKGLWYLRADYYEIHDYLQWNDSAAQRSKKRQEQADRVTRFRERQRGSRVIDLTPEQKGLDEGSRVAPEARNTEALSTPALTQTAVPDPVPPVRPVDRPNGRGGTPLITSPLAYAKLESQYGYLGPRFRVPKQFHEELVGRFGGDEQVARDTLAAWYRGLEDALPDDAAIPNIYKFINGHFEELVASRSASVPKAKSADDARQSITPEWRAQLEAAPRKTRTP